MQQKLRFARPSATHEGGKVLGELTRAEIETHSAQLRPLEIATATDVFEVKNGTR